MIWNPFKKKEDKKAEGTAAAPSKENKKETIEERIERELQSLPGPLKKQMSNPEVKAYRNSQTYGT
ncbi:hypothetical protein AAIR98_001918 [Elusimicrobium simillimum]|uniref:hypothetical protein n=1 Tax=Elusimicrobium simillimum TaxID=3143438 RepID=UPI003C6F6A2C